MEKIQTSQLILPLDVHVERTARNLKLLERKALDWQAVMELSSNCKKLYQMTLVCWIMHFLA